MKKMLSFLKHYKIQSILAPLFKLIEASFELIVPLVVANIIDIGIANNNRGYIISRCLILVLLGLIGMVSAITAQFFAAKASVGFGTELRHSLFKNIQSLSFSEVDKNGTSFFITALTSDANQVQSGVNLTLRLLLRSPFIVAGALVMAMTINIEIAIVFAVVIILLSIVEFVIIRVSVPKYKKVQENLEEVLNSTKENLDGARVIRAFCNEKEEINHFENTNKNLSIKQKSVGKISALNNPMTYVIVNIGIILVIYLGGIKVNTGVLLTGQVIALYNYMSQILVELLKLANLIITITKSFASGARLNVILDLSSSLNFENSNKTSNSLVEFKNVDLKYTGADENSLSNISFSGKKGEVIGIIGSTGSGKSSIVNLIPHFYDATNGTVFVFNKEVKSLDLKYLRSKIGIALQKAVLFKGTVRDNIRWGKENATDEEIVEALKFAEIYDIIVDKGGLDFYIEQDGNNVSGGQKQRLSIARAVVSKPEILIFDDSFSALDFVTESKIRYSVYNLNYNPLVFIVSQRTASIMNADKILVVDDGELVGVGTHNDLIKSNVVYQEIYSSQFKKEGE